jgi:four helix bundle protein
MLDSRQIRHPKPLSFQSAPGKHNALERLDCYRLALELSAVASTLVPRGHASLRDQLERATSSSLLNLAEGWGGWQPREKAHHYTIARGGALESAAIIDLLRARQLANDDDCVRARKKASRVAEMLSALIRSVGSRPTMVGRR